MQDGWICESTPYICTLIVYLGLFVSTGAPRQGRRGGDAVCKWKIATLNWTQPQIYIYLYLFVYIGWIYIYLYIYWLGPRDPIQSSYLLRLPAPPHRFVLSWNNLMGYHCIVRQWCLAVCTAAVCTSTTPSGQHRQATGVRGLFYLMCTRTTPIHATCSKIPNSSSFILALTSEGIIT